MRSPHEGGRGPGRGVNASDLTDMEVVGAWLCGVCVCVNGGFKVVGCGSRVGRGHSCRVAKGKRAHYWDLVEPKVVAVPTTDSFGCINCIKGYTGAHCLRITQSLTTLTPCRVASQGPHSPHPSTGSQWTEARCTAQTLHPNQR